MKPEESRRGAVLLREMALLQGKLFIDAARDLVLSPIVLAACALDLILIGHQPPRFFHAALRLGKRSDEWIDLWSPVEQRERTPENVDALVERIEALIRDPATGARRARVLKRWLERHLARQRRRPAAPPLPPPPP